MPVLKCPAATAERGKKMRWGLLSAVVLTMAAATTVPATAAADTRSLAGFVSSCATDSRACHDVVSSAVISARSANYGCIPQALSSQDASNQLLDWMKGTANSDPQYRDQSLPDVMWSGIDVIWPCPH
jgi:hypothetical protein